MHGNAAVIPGPTPTASIPKAVKSDWQYRTGALWEKKDWLALIEECKAWSVAEPDELEAWYCVAMAGLYSKRYEEALIGFEGYRQRENPALLTHHFVHNEAHVLGELGRYNDAIRMYKVAIAIDSSNPVTWNNLGWMFIKSKRYQEAINPCLTAIKQRADYAEAWDSLGHAYRGLGQYQMALDAHEKAVQLSQDNPDNERGGFWLPLGELYVITGQLEKAQRILELLVSMDSRRAEILRKMISEKK
jgi:tetratricopeptide (TPR) repeat protein